MDVLSFFLLLFFFLFGIFSTDESLDFSSLTIYYYFFNSVYIECRWPQTLEEGTGSPETQVTGRCELPCLGSVIPSTKALGILQADPCLQFLNLASLPLVRLGDRSTKQEWRWERSQDGVREHSRTLWRLKSSFGYRLRGKICENEDKNRQRREVKYHF